MLHWCCVSYRFDKCVWHISIITISCRIVSLSHKSSVFCLVISPSLLTRGNLWSFHCLHNFAFPKCHVVGKIESVAFLDGLLSLNNMCLMYLHERYPIGDGPQIYLAVHERQVLSKSTKIAMLPNSMVVAQSWFIYSIGHNLITSSFLRHFLQMEGNQLS